MSNNINNLNGFNAINFSGKGKPEKEETTKCDCPECIETEASAMEAMESAGRAQLAVKGPYKFDHKNVAADVAEFQDLALDAEFAALNDYALQKFGK